MHRTPPPAVLVAFLALIPALASGRTLTASDGRSIEAEVLGFEELEKVRIKRADTGQVFTLPISSFSEADQQALRQEAADAAARPVPLQKGDITLKLSRLRFASRKHSQDVPVDGALIRDAIVTTEEDWGYTLILDNHTGRPIKNLRAEYFLYAKIDAPKNSEIKPRIRREKFSLALDVVPATDGLSVRSEAITTHKVELKDGFVWDGTGDNKTRDSLEGIWLRLYQGDELVLEISSPPALAMTGKWTTDGD